MRALLGLTVLLLPFAAALPTDIGGEEVCDVAFDAGVCTSVMTLGADARLSYTQEVLGCDASSCTYRPTARLALTSSAPGEWVLRATTYATHYPSNAYLAGSAKTLECVLDDAAPTCTDAAVSRDVVGNAFNSARWHGEWRLYLVDPTGEEHLQAAWSGTGWLAQYCACPG